MPNHVHLVVDTRLQPYSHAELDRVVSLSRIIKLIKGGSAYEANKCLKQRGGFWQQESYDHWIRDEKECDNIIRYTLQNPVKAGLAVTWKEWPYNYINKSYLGM